MPEKCNGCCSYFFCLSVAVTREEDFEAYATKRDCEKRVFHNEDRIVNALEEIKKGCWSNGDFYTVIENAIGLINRQQAKIEALQMDNEQLQSDIVNANMNAEHELAEIERLQAEVDKQYEIAEANVRAEIASGGTSCHWCEGKARAEAIKEFAQDLKEALYFTELGTPVVDVSDIDDFVKEMVGDDNG